MCSRKRDVVKKVLAQTPINFKCAFFHLLSVLKIHFSIHLSVHPLVWISYRICRLPLNQWKQRCWNLPPTAVLIELGSCKKIVDKGLQKWGFVYKVWFWSILHERGNIHHCENFWSISSELLKMLHWCWLAFKLTHCYALISVHVLSHPWHIQVKVYIQIPFFN